MRAYLVLSGLLFGAVALAHLLRLFYGWAAQINAWAVPLWVSWLGVAVAGLLCIWAFALARGARGA